MSEQERVLFVHAHPDDETITTGGTLATLVDRGALVTVVTCTRGELGEVIPPDLQHLLSSEESLAQHREGELRAALAILGVTDHRFLGEADARWPGREPRTYLDSGMEWGAAGPVPLAIRNAASLTMADFGEVAADVAAVVADMKPDVIISYNDDGGYGHPDHVRASQAARRAAEVYGIPFFAIEPSDSAEEPSFTVDVSAVLDRKRAALRAHRTQAVVDGDTFELSNGVPHPLEAQENFRRIHREFPTGPVPFTEQSKPVQAVSTVIGLFVGLCVGALLTVAHESSAVIFGVTVPLGLIGGILIITALLVGLRLVSGSRLIAGAAAIGIMVAVGVLSLRSAGGSVLVQGETIGYIWAFAPTLVALFVVGWPRVHSAARDRIVSSSEVKGSLHK